MAITSVYQAIVAASNIRRSEKSIIHSYRFYGAIS